MKTANVLLVDMLEIRELAISRVADALEASPGEWCDIVVDAVLDAIYDRLNEENTADDVFLVVWKELLRNGE